MHSRQPEFHGWAFNLPVGAALHDKWKQVPDGIDVLITHGPPKGELSMILIFGLSFSPLMEASEL